MRQLTLEDIATPSTLLPPELSAEGWLLWAEGIQYLKLLSPDNRLYAYRKSDGEKWPLSTTPAPHRVAELRAE